MTKTRASKIKAGDQIASKTQSATVRQGRADKSATASKPKAAAPRPGKIDKIIALMRRPKGATITDLTKATAWQAHSVRGAISGTLRKKHGLNVVSERSSDVRLYRIADKAAG
jgi:hypothetical protein